MNQRVRVQPCVCDVIATYTHIYHPAVAFIPAKRVAIHEVARAQCPVDVATCRSYGASREAQTGNQA